MNEVINLLNDYATKFINTAEYFLNIIWSLPIFKNINLGSIILFLIICSFIFSFFTHYLGGDNDD